MNDEKENNEADIINDEFPIDYFNEGIDINLTDTIDLTEIINMTYGDENE